MITDEEIAVIENDFNERVFWMSGVEAGVILSEFEDKVKKYTKGEISGQEAQRLLRDVLRREKYIPPEGKEDTLQDLSSWVRMQTVLQTNDRMWHGYKNWIAEMKIDDVVAFAFYRSSAREDPRHWFERWSLARVGLESEATEALSTGFERQDIVAYALKRSDIWKRISRFNNPYPPFDFLSGMSIRPIRKNEWEALGYNLTYSNENQALPSLNETLQSTASKLSEKQTRRIKKELKNAVKVITSDKQVALEYSDPNGTREYTDKELSEVLTADYPENIEPHQARAFKTAFSVGVIAGSVASIYFDRLINRIFAESNTEWYAKLSDVASISSKQFIQVSPERTDKYTYPITSDKVKKVSDVAEALDVEIETPYILSAKWITA